MPNVYEFSDPVEYLNASFRSIKDKNPQFSLRAWAKLLGCSNVGTLSLVMTRKRPIRASLGTQVGEYFVQSGKFSESEARYFGLLVMYANAESAEQKLLLQGVLSSLRPDQEFSTLELDRFRVISNWYHFAILEMTFLADFVSDPEWIQNRIGNSVSIAQVKEAISRLLRLSLLTKENGTLIKTNVRLATPTDRPDEGLKKLHAEMIHKSLTALATVPVESRDITGSIMTVSRDKLPEAKRMIREFRNKLMEFVETPGGDDVFQLNVQLFSVLGGKSNA